MADEPKVKRTLKSGLNPFAYMGTEPIATFSFRTYDRAPTVNDVKNYNVGDIWLHRITPTNVSEEVWILVKILGNVATWIKFGTSLDIALRFPGNVGVAVPDVNGVLNILSGAILTTAGAVDTVTLGLTNGADGEVLIGATGGDPIWTMITSLGGTVNITGGPNTLNLEIPGIGGIVSFTADDAGVAVIDGAGNINMFGAPLNITTVGAADTLTINLDDDVFIVNSLTLSAQGAGVMQTTAAGVVFSDNGTDGQILIGGGTEPNWANISSLDGSVTIANGPNTIDLSRTNPGGFSQSFLATQTMNAIGVLGTGAGYHLGEDVALIEVFDTGNNLDPGDGIGGFTTFTAPVDGVYYLNAQIAYYSNGDNDLPLPMIMRIETSNRDYVIDIEDDGDLPGYGSHNITTFADMDIADTAVYYMEITDTITASINVVGTDITEPITWVSGYLAFGV